MNLLKSFKTAIPEIIFGRRFVYKDIDLKERQISKMVVSLKRTFVGRNRKQINVGVI